MRNGEIPESFALQQETTPKSVDPFISRLWDGCIPSEAEIALMQTSEPEWADRGHALITENAREEAYDVSERMQSSVMGLADIDSHSAVDQRYFCRSEVWMQICRYLDRLLNL